MKHSPQWTQTDKLGDGNSRERRPSGASSNQSLTCRQRGGPKEYGTRIFENGRHSRASSRISEGEVHRMQHLPFELHQSSEHMSQAQSVPVDVEFLQRTQWPGNNVRQTSHRSHSATNRTIHVNGINRDIDRERDTCRRTPNTDGNIKLENKKQGGPVTYIAAGTAPVASFRSTVSPVPTSVVSSPSSGGYANSMHSIKRPISFSPSLSVEDVKCEPVTYRKHKYSGIDIGKGQHSMFNHDPRNNRYGGQKEKRTMGAYHTSSARLPFSPPDCFVSPRETERNAYNKVNFFESSRHNFLKRNSRLSTRGPGSLSRVLAELDIQQALERMSTMKDENSKDVNWIERQGDGARAAYPIAGGVKSNHSLHPSLAPRTNIPQNHLANGHEDSSILAGSRMQRNATGEMILPEEMMPMLMRIVQTQALPQIPAEDGQNRDENSLINSANTWAGMPPAMMQQLATVLNQQVQSQTGAHSNPSASTPSTPVRQNYSSVVARNSQSSDSTAISESGKNAPVAYAAKAALQPKCNVKREEKAAIAPILLPLVSDRESKRSSDEKSLKVVTGDTGESGYQSESSPPVAAVSSKPRFGSSVSIPSGSKLTDLSEATQAVDSARSSVSSSKPPTPPPTSPLNTSGHFEVSKMDVLSEEIWHYHNSVTQTDAMLNQKLHLRDLLYYSICPVFPMCGLYVVGSSLNGFGNNSSDMDLCLMITNKDLDQKTDAVVVLNMILNALSPLEWVASQKLILAKVPILRIKFNAPFSDITVDLNANNSVAIKNTHLLCYYSSFDWRVRPLVSVVKEWAKRKGINDANRSSFTSYSLVLMVIHYLQCGADPPVLPSLQQMYPKLFSSKCDVRTLNVTQALPTPADEWEYSDKATLGELLIGFLDYYANKFNYDRDAISVRQGKRVDRASLARNRPVGTTNAGSWRSQWRCICIEEPFTLSNTAHSIYDEMVFGAIKNAFREAHLELEQSRDLQTLLSCKSITVNAPMGGAVVYSTSYDGTRTILSESSPSPPTSQPNMSLMPSGSANSLNTAQSGSSASSSNGDEPDEHPSNDRLPTLSSGIIIRRSGDRRTSGRRRQPRKSAEVSTAQLAACRT